MLIPLAAGTLTGLHAFFLYLIAYLITIFVFFGLIISIQKKNNKNLIYLTDLLFIEKLNPLLKFMFIITLFSLAGIPPLIGFFSKLYILFVTIETKTYFIVGLIIISSTISAFYYIRLIKILSFEKLNIVRYIKSLDTETILIYTILSILVLSFFNLTPNFLLTKAYQIALLV
jgi:NADH-quinone oxidoreductase subunit N